MIAAVEKDTDTALEIEAAWVVRRMRELQGELMLAGGPAQFGDMALLLRNLEVLPTFTRAFDDAGVPYLVSQGKGFFSPAMSRLLADDYVRQMQERGAQDSYELLSPREREVIMFVADGLSNAAIAKRLSISEHTAKRHVANILLKLDLPTRAAAAAVAGLRRRG